MMDCKNEFLKYIQLEAPLTLEIVRLMILSNIEISDNQAFAVEEITKEIKHRRGVRILSENIDV